MRRATSPAPAGAGGLTRRDFLIIGAATGVGVGLASASPTPVAAQPAVASAPAVPERAHRTLLGVL
jgi:hypothetical protein